jgi:hypothetical protein
MAVAKFFLGHLFDDSEQTEAILFSDALNLYFVLRLNSLSYVYATNGEVIELAQWRFIGNKLYVELDDYTYVIALRSESPEGLEVIVAKVKDKKVVKKYGGKLYLIQDVSSSELEKFISKQATGGFDSSKLKGAAKKLLPTVLVIGAVAYVLLII